MRVAWQMTRALAEFSAEQFALDLPMLTNDIGISSGEMVAGRVGAASRLQVLTKEWGVPVLLSEETRRGLSHARG